MSKKPDPKDYPPLTPHDLEWGGIGSKYYEDYAKWEKESKSNQIGGGLIGVSIKGNVLNYTNSASIKLGDDDKVTAIAMDGKIFLPEENKSNDRFQWDDKLACEWAGYLEERMKSCLPSAIPLILALWKETKSSTPKPQAENKPDWEIVKFELYYNKGSVMSVRDENGKFKTRNGIIADEAYMLLKYPIHSVKRLSDGEVFSVGDEVEVANSKYKIQSFKPNPFQMEVHVGMSYPLHFASMKKLPPQPQKEEQAGRNISSYSEIPQKLYTQQQVDAMCEDAFNAAREVFEEQVTGRIEYINGDWSLHHPPKYMNFKDYKQSKQ